MRYHDKKVTIFVVVFAGCCLGYAQSKHIDEEKSPPRATSQQHQYDQAQYDDSEVAQESANSYYPSFPSFDSPPLGHSRPFYFHNNNNNQEGAYSQRSQPFEQLFDGADKYGFTKEDYIPVPETPKSDNILGSGNFGVIKGGTFFSDDDGSEHSNSYGDFGSSYSNGHGRPSYYNKQSSNSKPRYQQFANFKDFADINTPSIRQYSQKVNIYANRDDSDAAESKEDESRSPPEIPNSTDKSVETLSTKRNSNDDMESFSLKQSEMSSENDKIVTVYPLVTVNKNTSKSTGDDTMRDAIAAFRHIFEVLGMFEERKNNTLKRDANGKYGLHRSETDLQVPIAERGNYNDTKNEKNSQAENTNIDDIYIEVLKVATESSVINSTATSYLDKALTSSQRYGNNHNKPQNVSDERRKQTFYPNNIIESLTLLDTQFQDVFPEKKLSKSKQKLAQLHPEKKHKAKLLLKEKLTRDLSDPLLALS